MGDIDVVITVSLLELVAKGDIEGRFLKPGLDASVVAVVVGGEEGIDDGNVEGGVESGCVPDDPVSTLGPGLIVIAPPRPPPPQPLLLEAVAAFPPSPDPFDLASVR